MKKSIIIFLLLFVLCDGVYAQAAVLGLPSQDRATFSLSPRTETILQGSTFDVSVFLDTHGTSVNAIELNLKFSHNTLSVVKRSNGTSLITLWVEPPTYSNTDGTARFSGVIPNGITTSDGLITTITFEAKTIGQAIIEVLPSSKVLANDGLGTSISSEFGRGVYTITPRPPEGVKVFSETHQFENKWYNNNNVTLTWEKVVGITDFSIDFDNKPVTSPDNIPDTQETLMSYENVHDGVWYFHIKARKDNVWGAATHFAVHIDSTPPAGFRPRVEVLNAALIRRALVSFFTTDTLSGLDHYEVGVIDKAASPLSSPVFTQAQSPYQLPIFVSGNLRAIVRAVDRAGNVRDESIDISLPFSLWMIFSAILALIFMLVIFHYVFGHKLLRRVKRVIRLMKRKK